ncbi:MAG: hypothetical protein AAGJ80_10170 [Cyanobacteria bacterium J06553_1]
MIASLCLFDEIQLHLPFHALLDDIHYMYFPSPVTAVITCNDHQRDIIAHRSLFLPSTCSLHSDVLVIHAARFFSASYSPPSPTLDNFTLPVVNINVSIPVSRIRTNLRQQLLHRLPMDANGAHHLHISSSFVAVFNYIYCITIFHF